MQGEEPDVARALARGEREAAQLNDQDRVLLEFVELLTRHSYRNTPEDVERVRKEGWSDEQLAEAVYVTAMFAFFNRVADAFGLADPGYFDLASGAKAPPRPGQEAG